MTKLLKRLHIWLPEKGGQLEKPITTMEKIH